MVGDRVLWLLCVLASIVALYGCVFLFGVFAAHAQTSIEGMCQFVRGLTVEDRTFLIQQYNIQAAEQQRIIAECFKQPSRRHVKRRAK